jgi:hypothetical protein
MTTDDSDYDRLQLFVRSVSDSDRWLWEITYETYLTK